MRQNRRRTGSRRSADDKIKYMRMAAIPLVIVLVLVAVILVMDRKPSDKEASASTGVSLSSDEDINITAPQRRMIAGWSRTTTSTPRIFPSMS